MVQADGLVALNSSVEGRLVSNSSSKRPCVPCPAPPRFGMTGATGNGFLKVSGVRLRFGGVAALDGADLAVRAGTITGLIGPNGAGKTTLFNCISGMLRPNAGEIRFAGKPIAGSRPDEIAATGLARTFQIARGLPTLSVLDNLMLYGTAQPGESLWRAVIRPPQVARRETQLQHDAWAMLKRLEMEKVANLPAASLSGGQKKLLELGRALMRRPKMVLLDEPAAGVNPGLAKRLVSHVLAWRDEGVTFLLIEHSMSLIAELCDHVVVMAEGKRLAEGSFDAVRADERVQAAYMGARH